VEQHCAEFLEWKRREFGIFLADEVFVEPVPEIMSISCVAYQAHEDELRLFHLETYPLERLEFLVGQIENEATDDVLADYVSIRPRYAP
jgi:hypothetical protein